MKGFKVKGVIGRIKASSNSVAQGKQRLCRKRKWIATPALTSAVLLVVQASGEISVHVLVHAHFDISPGRPFAPCGRSRGQSLLQNTLLIPGHAHRDGRVGTLAPFGDYL